MDPYKGLDARSDAMIHLTNVAGILIFKHVQDCAHKVPSHIYIWMVTRSPAPPSLLTPVPILHPFPKGIGEALVYIHSLKVVHSNAPLFHLLGPRVGPYSLF